MKHNRRTIVALMTAAILCAAVLSSCGQPAPQPSSGQQPMTQPIVTDEPPAQPSGDAQPAAQTPAQPAVGESGQIQAPAIPEDLTYYQAKALEKAADLDIEQLEIDYRMGKLSEADFSKRKQELWLEEESYDNLADRLEYQLPLYTPTQEEDASRDLSQLLGWYQDAEIAKEMEEREGDKLAMDYQSGSITREELVSQLEKQQEKEFQAEQRADWLEDRLEMLGWDD